MYTVIRSDQTLRCSKCMHNGIPTSVYILVWPLEQNKTFNSLLKWFKLFDKYFFLFCGIIVLKVHPMHRRVVVQIFTPIRLTGPAGVKYFQKATHGFFFAVYEFCAQSMCTHSPGCSTPAGTHGCTDVYLRGMSTSPERRRQTVNTLFRWVQHRQTSWRLESF